jgi:TonB family protein
LVNLRVVDQNNMFRPLLLALLCSLCFAVSYCQKIQRYYTYEWHDTDAVNARFYSLIEKTDSGWHRRDYYLHSLYTQMEGLYEDSACKTPTGYFHWWYPNRFVQMEGRYTKGKRQGLWLSFYSNGMMSDSSVYEAGRAVGTRESWYRNGFMRDSAVCNADGSGTLVSWFDNGYPASAGRYGPGSRPSGRWKYFYRDGPASALETYDGEGKLVDKQYFDRQGNPQPDTTGRDKAAQFPGGLKAWAQYLSKALYFPSNWKFTNGDEAAVVVAATVNEEGKVIDAEVIIPFYPDFDKIALDALRRSPAWTPAYQHNRAVRYDIRQPVLFSQPD